MTVAERIEAMNALFAGHDRLFAHPGAFRPQDYRKLRRLDAAAQAMKAALIADGVRLVPDRSGYFTEGATE